MASSPGNKLTPHSLALPPPTDKWLLGFGALKKKTSTADERSCLHLCSQKTFPCHNRDVLISLPDVFLSFHHLSPSPRRKKTRPDRLSAGLAAPQPAISQPRLARDSRHDWTEQRGVVGQPECLPWEEPSWRGLLRSSGGAGCAASVIPWRDARDPLPSSFMACSKTSLWCSGMRGLLQGCLALRFLGRRLVGLRRLKTLI